MEMYLKVCFSFVVLLSTAGADFSVQPASQPTTCAGSDLLLDWTINDGSDISTVIWSFKGTGFAAKSGINGAITYTGSIIATDVEHTTSGIIVIKKSEDADSGEYACSITYTGASVIAAASSTATVAVVTAPSDPTCTKTGNTYTCATDSTSVTVTIKIDDVDKGTNTYTGSVVKSVKCCLSGYAVQCRDDTSDTEQCKLMPSCSPADTPTLSDGSLPIAGIVIGGTYGLSLIGAAGVNLFIYNKNQARLAWKLCDGPMNRLWIWLLLFIFLPYIPSAIAIYLFRTKPTGKPTKPVISPKSVSVNVGDTATFTCTSSSTADSGLTMSYTWRRNRVDMKSEGQYMVSSETLTVTEVVKGDASDKFTCIAREENGPPSDESDSARIVISKLPSEIKLVEEKLGNYGPISPLPPINHKKNSDPQKGSLRKLPEPPNPEDGNRLSPLKSSNITETQQANGEQEKKKKKKKKKPKNNQVSDEEMEKSS